MRSNIPSGRQHVSCCDTQRIERSHSQIMYRKNPLKITQQIQVITKLPVQQALIAFREIAQTAARKAAVFVCALYLHDGGPLKRAVPAGIALISGAARLSSQRPCAQKGSLAPIVHHRPKAMAKRARTDQTPAAARHRRWSRHRRAGTRNRSARCRRRGTPS